MYTDADRDRHAIALRSISSEEEEEEEEQEEKQEEDGRRAGRAGRVGRVYLRVLLVPAELYSSHP